MGRLAYSLQRSQAGWAWRVLDERGLTLAAGSADSRPSALHALDMTLRAFAQVRLTAAPDGAGGG